MKSLIIGMGIGKLYQSVLNNLGYTVITVDSNPAVHADFTDYKTAYKLHKFFDTVHICTPNFTHREIANDVASMGAGIIFIEKPGVLNSEHWNSMVNNYPSSRFMMVKNNQYRTEIDLYKSLAEKSSVVKITWNNRNRIPNPGSWFTNKALSFGGVSRDLIPHMLSYYCALSDFEVGKQVYRKIMQNWTLDNIESTDYGVITRNGVYDVDDFCELHYHNNSTTYVLSANWKSDTEDKIGISFLVNGTNLTYKLGLCPEAAYQSMIQHAIINQENSEFWVNQYNQDMWIHQQLENL